MMKQITKNEWSALFFDFDGVILDTTKMKAEAFASMYARHGKELLKKALAYHREHGGISRVIKLKYIEEKLLGRSISQEKLNQLAKEYSARTIEKVKHSNFIPGAKDVIESLNGKLAFVISGTPQTDLDEIVDDMDLRRYFKEVHGSPRLKPDIARDIIKRYDLDPKECLFFGDAPTDLRTAKELKMHFIGVEPPGESHPFGPEIKVIKTLNIPKRNETTSFS